MKQVTRISCSLTSRRVFSGIFMSIHGVAVNYWSQTPIWFSHSMDCTSFHRINVSCIFLIDVTICHLYFLMLPECHLILVMNSFELIFFYVMFLGMDFKCRCYIKLFDSPSKSMAEEEEEMSKLPPSQRKKMKQKQKKAEARAKKVC